MYGCMDVCMYVCMYVCIMLFHHFFFFLFLGVIRPYLGNEWMLHVKPSTDLPLFSSLEDIL